MRTFNSELESRIYLNKRLSAFVEAVKNDKVSKDDIINAINGLHNVCSRSLTMIAHNHGITDGIYGYTENRIIGSLLRDGKIALDLEFEQSEQITSSVDDLS